MNIDVVAIVICLLGVVGLIVVVWCMSRSLIIQYFKTKEKFWKRWGDEIKKEE